jgi:hypothetical protein
MRGARCHRTDDEIGIERELAKLPRHLGDVRATRNDPGDQAVRIVEVHRGRAVGQQLLERDRVATVERNEGRGFVEQPAMQITGPDPDVERCGLRIVPGHRIAGIERLYPVRALEHREVKACDQLRQVRFLHRRQRHHDIARPAVVANLVLLSLRPGQEPGSQLPQRRQRYGRRWLCDDEGAAAARERRRQGDGLEVVRVVLPAQLLPHGDRGGVVVIRTVRHRHRRLLGERRLVIENVRFWAGARRRHAAARRGSPGNRCKQRRHS